MTPFGFHVSVGGNRTGIGRHFQQLDAAGIPIALVSIGDYGAMHEVVLLMKASNVPHVLIYRVTDLDVANYELDPATAALRHWAAVLAKLPPEFDRERVWLCPVNEIDKGRADWLGNFATVLASQAIAGGYKVTMFGWSSGEPEPEHWQLPGMRRYLELCAINPDKAAVALHEYSLTLEDIRHEFPYKIGRFQALFAACDAMGIGRPTVHITEWGWTHEEVPEPTQALVDIDWAYRLYAQYPEIEMVAIWGLISGFAGIANLCQRLIEPVTGFMLNAPAVSPIPPTIPPIVPPPAPPPAPPPSIIQKVVIQSTAGRGNVRTLPETTAATLIGSVPNGTQFEVIEDVPNWYGVKVYVSKIVAKPVEDEPPVEPPPAVFSLASPVKGIPLFVTDWFNTPRSYAGEHEGLDLRATNAAGQPVQIVAAAAGIVDGIRPVDPGTGYGIYVRLKHERPGVTYKTWYCHLTRVAPGLQVGQAVTTGQVLGTAGSTGNSSGVHLHLTVQKIPGGLSGYVIDSVVDPAPLLGLAPPSTPHSVDLVPYFSPANGSKGDIIILRNSWGEGDERQQLQQSGSNLYVTKNASFEQRVIRASTIDLVLDTSRGNGEMYTVSGPWIPKQMAVGETFTRTETVQVKRKDNCQNVGNSYTSTSQIKFAAKYDSLPIEGGVTIQDVIELHWILNGVIEEKYFFGRHKGLCQWKPKDGRRSWATEVIPYGQQEDNQREVIGCL